MTPANPVAHRRARSTPTFQCALLVQMGDGRTPMMRSTLLLAFAASVIGQDTSTSATECAGKAATTPATTYATIPWSTTCASEASCGCGRGHRIASRSAASRGLAPLAAG